MRLTAVRYVFHDQLPHNVGDRTALRLGFAPKVVGNLSL